MAGQDNITHDGTYPGRIEGGNKIYTHTHTYDTNYFTLLLRDIQLINTKRTPYKHRTNAASTQSRRSNYAGPTKNDHRTKTLGASSRPK